MAGVLIPGLSETQLECIPSKKNPRHLELGVYQGSRHTRLPRMQNRPVVNLCLARRPKLNPITALTLK